MLRPLKINKSTFEKDSFEKGKDAEIAGAIVDHIFQEVSTCVQCDRSRVKLGMFEKGLIGGMLNDKVKNGIKNFIFNMNNIDVGNLLDDIQRDLAKRKK